MKVADTMEEPVVKNRVALVTGGAGGIGEAVSHHLGRSGVSVVIGDKDDGGAQNAVKRMHAAGFKAASLCMDVSDSGSVSTGFAKIESEFGRCDILVNNAGIARGNYFLDYSLADWEAVMQVNVTGTFLCSQHAARMMARENWGRIVNVVSIAGIKASVGRTAYGPSKAAIISLTKQIAIELALSGITCNAVAPGPVDTPLTRASHSDKTRALYHSQIPMRRYGTADEIAAAVSFLASEQSSYITGQVLAVDGGFVVGGLLER
ncbi:3-oxoacyl-ACP reductase family protein [Variovorax sp. WDL1]|uniref:SDR family NAD(P)-dependent oxidoreductase n=2 Tax=Variovorax TaxID=34072 RepID=UPI002FC38225